MSNITPKIEFRKTRDFGQIFSDITRFIKFNFKTIFACVLFLPGPLFLIAGCFYGYMQALGTDPSKMVGFGMFRDPFGTFAEIISAMLPYFVFISLGVLVSNATVDRYFILYQEREGNNRVTISDIVKHLPADVWRLFYNNLLLILVLILALIPVVLIAMIPVLGVVVLVIGALLAGPQIAYAVTAGSYLVLRDKILITTAISKAWGYMKGNFWWTWVIIVVGTMIVGFIGVVFTLPMTVLTVFNTVTRMSSNHTDNNTVLYVVLGCITIIGPQLLTPITKLFSVLTYHSYEEAHEGMSIKEKIDQLGNS
jgi:hypothetical protein